MQVNFFSDNIFMNLSMIISIILFLFLAFLLFTFLYSLLTKKDKYMALVDCPYVSLLIPCYNEEENIEGCIDSIVNSDYPLDKLEILVLDDKSKDNTVAVVKEKIKSLNMANIKLIEGKHKGKSETLNDGLKKATHELIMSVDADIHIEKDTIHKLVGPMEKNDVAATNAVAVIRDPKRMIEYFQMIEFCLNNLIRTSFSKTFKNSIWFFGAVACYKKKVLNEVGNFKKDTLTEDMDICLEMYNKKYKIVTVENAFISTKACSNSKELFSQRMRWYFGALQSLFKNRGLMKKDRRSPSVLFLFFNQYWWTFFSFVFFPMTIFQVFYWWPETEILGVFSYIFRWFSLSGPFYVIYKMPDWGLNMLNIFAISAGIITFLMSIAALKKFKGEIHAKTLLGLFFYFPYTILHNAIIVTGVIKYRFSKIKYFID